MWYVNMVDVDEAESEDHYEVYVTLVASIADARVS